MVDEKSSQLYTCPSRQYSVPLHSTHDFPLSPVTSLYPGRHLQLSADCDRMGLYVL